MIKLIIVEIGVDIKILICIKNGFDEIINALNLLFILFNSFIRIVRKVA